MSIQLRLSCTVFQQCIPSRTHKVIFFFGSLNGGVVFASQVKASSAEFLWDAMQGCCGAAAEISFAAHVVEVTEVPAVLAEESSRLEGMCG